MLSRGESNGTVTAEYIAPDLRQLAFPVNELRHSPDNARKHSDFDIGPLAETLDGSRQQKPVVAKHWYRGVLNAVIAGNGTLEAARRLGWQYLAVSWFDGTDEEAREFAISDNRTAELSEWDTDQLALLVADGVDLLSLWHDDAALADLLHEAAPVPKFQAEAPAHRLDELAAHCPTCSCRRAEAR